MNMIDITFLDIMSQSMIIVMVFFIEDLYTKAIAYRVWTTKEEVKVYDGRRW